MWGKSNTRDIDKEFEEKYPYYCFKCKTRMKSKGFPFCNNEKCERYGLLTVIGAKMPNKLDE